MPRSADKSFPPALFWSKVDKTGPKGCWLWTGRLDKDGYGHYGRYLAHRLSWQAAYGDIPDGLLIRHRCDVRCCVNPEHLLTGTNRDNFLDMVQRGRGHKGFLKLLRHAKQKDTTPQEMQRQSESKKAVRRERRRRQRANARRNAALRQSDYDLDQAFWQRLQQAD